jgi:hypothetical protein
MIRGSAVGAALRVVRRGGWQWLYRKIPPKSRQPRSGNGYGEGAASSPRVRVNPEKTFQLAQADQMIQSDWAESNAEFGL